MIDTCFRIVDRRASYFARSALERAKDPQEFQRRYYKGMALQAGLSRPKAIKPGTNIIPLIAALRTKK